MAKRTRKKPVTVVDTLIPVYIPTEDGYGELELGKAQIKGQSLIIEFNNKLPSVAIQSRIARGGIVGVTFVIPPDEAEEARQSEAELERQKAEPEVEETEEEKAAREAEEEQQAKIDAVYLEAELDRLEE